MNCLMSYGEINNDLLYIFFVIIFNILNNCFYGLNNNEAFETIQFFKNSKISNHILIRFFFNYIIIAIINICLCYYDYYIIKKEKSNKNLIIVNTKIKLIHYDVEEKMQTKKVKIISFIIYVLWFIEEVCLICFIVSLKDIDFWMIELIFLALLTLKIFNINIYKHQWLAIYISLISFALKIISIIVTFLDEDKYRKYEEGLPILYRINPYYLLGFFLYLFLIFLRSSVNSGLKWLMEKKYTPLNAILMWHGIIGSICSLICIIFSSFPFSYCKELETIDINNKTNYSYSNYLCKVKINESNKTKEYLDNFYDYFEKEHWKSHYIEELLAIFFDSLTFYFYQYFSLMIIKNLSPAHFSFSIPISFFFQKMINISYTILSEGKFFIVDEDFKIIKFLLDTIGDEISIFGFLIYLEILVLHFCGFDYNIKENIIERSSRDTSNKTEETISFNINGDETINEN